jgi:prepilin-type N-terminal cleavage/methylation domain-containing protein
MTPMAKRRRGGFTLIELMIVIGIIAIVAGIGVPTLLRVFRKEALRQAVSDIIEVSSNARAFAIQRGEVVELIIKPDDRSVSVSGGGGETKPGPGPNRLSMTWAESLGLELLDVNFGPERRDLPETRVRFFPNGTCDEATLIFVNDANERRMIWWDVMTALPLWEADPNKFLKR